MNRPSDSLRSFPSEKRPSLGRLAPHARGHPAWRVQTVERLYLGKLWQLLHLCDLPRGSRALDVIEIPGELEVEPELRLHTQQSFEPQSGVRGDPPFALDKLIHTRVRHAHPLGQLRLRQTERHQELLEQHFSGVSRGPMRWNSNQGSLLYPACSQW